MGGAPEYRDETLRSLGDRLTDLRADVRTNTQDIAGKADRARVHDLAVQVATTTAALDTVTRLAQEVAALAVSLANIDLRIAHIDDTLDGRIDERLEERAAQTWTTTQRLTALALFLLQLITVAVVVYAHAGS